MNTGQRLRKLEAKMLPHEREPLHVLWILIDSDDVDGPPPSILVWAGDGRERRTFDRLPDESREAFERRVYTEMGWDYDKERTP